MPKKMNPRASAFKSTGAKAALIYPKPEAVAPGKWQIDSTIGPMDVPRVDNHARRAIVPLDASKQSRAVRAHEMGHAKWSPKTYPKGYDPQAILAAEDARVNLASRAVYDSRGATDNIMDYLYDESHAEQVSPEALVSKPLFDAACLSVAALGSNLETITAESIRRLLDSEAPNDRARGQALKNAMDRGRKTLSPSMKRDPATGGYAKTPARFARTKDLARYLYDLALTDREQEEARRKSKPGSKPGDDATGPADGSMADERRDDLDAMVSRVAGRRREGKTLHEIKDEARHGDGTRKPASGPASKGIDWGSLTIKTVRLVKSFKSRTAMKPRPFEEGAAFQHPERLYIDGRIFSRLLPNAGGTILIDHSGSMSLTADQVREIIDEAPAAVVATYSGQGTEGALKVVAAKGRMAEGHDLTARPSGGGNIVDGPALRWLAKQKGPRIWVSDGAVTGHHDQFSVDLTQEAISLCLRHKIYRVDNPKDAARILATRL